ncbi:hypothetical protein [Mesorhizobium sp. B2-6-4]|uniref:hypothetical protein n=1 Tax=Mesorhizobium sp. B2-6-4 TaxID=2589913 RepID=UPI0011294333|nr:hypothetical protein [Mesorhizobium sp. B2-6-4]TPJ54802.1 hypothetical protein FJ426_07430 [Mesorhizobium sp. B2-6-4]
MPGTAKAAVPIASLKRVAIIFDGEKLLDTERQFFALAQIEPRCVHWAGWSLNPRSMNLQCLEMDSACVKAKNDPNAAVRLGRRETRGSEIRGDPDDAELVTKVSLYRWSRMVISYSNQKACDNMRDKGLAGIPSGGLNDFG